MLAMCNRLKTEQIIPVFMNFSNITTIPKSGSVLNPENQRGIFRVSVIRSILMRLIYNTKYPTIDKNMSDCQMGGRKKKGCKSNIWIINGTSWGRAVPSSVSSFESFASNIYTLTGGWVAGWVVQL